MFTTKYRATLASSTELKRGQCTFEKASSNKVYREGVVGPAVI